MAKNTENKKLKVTLVKSGIGRLEKQKRTLKALGLEKIGQEVIHNDNMHKNYDFGQTCISGEV